MDISKNIVVSLCSTKKNQPYTFATESNCDIYFSHCSGLKMEKIVQCNKELQDKCERGNKIAPLQHKCQVKRGKHAEGMQFYCPLSTYPAVY